MVKRAPLIQLATAFVARVFWITLSSSLLAQTPNAVNGQPTDASLVARYLLDGNALDSSGNEFHGMAYGTSPTTNRFGKPNSALTFDGASDGTSYIDLGNRPEFNFSGNFTISLWASGYGYAIAKYGREINSQSPRSYGINNASQNTYPGIQGFISGDDGSRINAFNVGVDYQTWHALALSYDKDWGIRFYLDGVLFASTAVTGLPPLINSLPLLIGRAAYGTGSFRGAIDDVRIYNRAFSAAEIQNLFRSDINADLQISRVVKIGIPTVVGQYYQLEVSSDFKTWSPIGAQFQATSLLSIQLVDAETFAQFFRFRAGR
jgi:hypothetical protein